MITYHIARRVVFTNHIKARRVLDSIARHPSTPHRRRIAPNELCEMARGFTEPGPFVIVLRAFETPGFDRCACVRVAGG